MTFKQMCERYIELSSGINPVKARRRIWPSSVHVVLGTMVEGAPLALVQWDDYGRQAPNYMKLGMILMMSGEAAVFGWCPSIDDVMGQDWMFISPEGR
jgi:hypothetical protein